MEITNNAQSCGIIGKETGMEKIEIIGSSEELLNVNKDGTMKSTRLFYNLTSEKHVNDEIVDVLITSTDMLGRHKIFDSLTCSGDIKITIEKV